MIAVITLASLLFPAFFIALGTRFSLIDKAGLVLLCFASGILLNTTANALGWASMFNSDDLISMQTQLTEISIALAIPLLVMSINLKLAVSRAGLTAKAMLAAFASILLCTFVLSLAFNGHIEKLWQVAGLAVGAYTGGGPNMAAINAAIEGDQTVFVRMTSYDIMLSALFLLFVLSIAKPIFRHVLPEFKKQEAKDDAHAQHFEHLGEESSRSYAELAKAHNLSALLKTFVFAALIVGLSLGTASLLPESMKSSGTIILITTFGMAASFIPAVQRLKISFRLGMYLVLVFCFTMGSMTNLAILADIDVALFSYIGLMLIAAMLVHALICKLLKVDVDTFLVTASAAIMSVPFIPVIVGALRNQALLVPGFCAAIIGYVLGNYFGIAVAIVLRSLLP
jgi:uncharacterized membrane protein